MQPSSPIVALTWIATREKTISKQNEHLEEAAAIIAEKDARITELVRAAASQKKKMEELEANYWSTRQANTMLRRQAQSDKAFKKRCLEVFRQRAANRHAQQARGVADQNAIRSQVAARQSSSVPRAASVVTVAPSSRSSWPARPARQPPSISTAAAMATAATAAAAAINMPPAFVVLPSAVKVVLKLKSQPVVVVGDAGPPGAAPGAARVAHHKRKISEADHAPLSEAQQADIKNGGVVITKERTLEEINKEGFEHAIVIE